MAAPSYTSDLTDYDQADNVANYSALGGGASALADETDYWIETPQCVSKGGFTAATKGIMLDDGGSRTVASGDAIFIWGKQNNRNLMDTIANGGMQVVIGNSTTAYDHFYVDGSDADGSDLAGWRTYAVDPTQTPSTTTGGGAAGTNLVGFLWKILGSGSLKGNPNAIDVQRHGRELQCTAGDLANGYATFTGAGAADATNTARWGILTPVAGGYQFHGCFVMGTTATAVDFRDSDQNIIVLEDPFVPAAFNEFEIRNASSNVEWTNIIIQHLGTTSPSTLTLDVGTFTGLGCQFNDCATTIFNSSGSCTESSWVGCGQITAAGADLTGSTVKDSTVTANNSMVIWNVATDPDGYLDDMTFDSTNSANAIHAIEFGTSSPTSITLRGLDFSGFSASQDVNDSTFHVKRTSGTVTINLVSCTSDVSLTNSYRTDGATVVIVQNPVTTKVRAVTATGTAISGARVFLEASDGTGPLPYQASVSITQSAGTATVSHTAHGFATNQYVVIRGANEEAYNKVAQITVTGANSYTYSVDSGTSSPATGSPVSSGVLVYGTTDVNGEVSDTRTLSSDQPVKGWARKSTSSPLYKTGPVTGTADSAANTTFSAVLISDE
jgi:hypothetical protein